MGETRGLWGNAALTDAEAFCCEVLAARPPPSLPHDGGSRARVLDLLRFHNLLGLWMAERPASESGPPDEVDPEMQALTALQSLRTELTIEAADRAVHALDAAGCELLLFKGASLLKSGVYSSPKARAIDDADILIRPHDVETAVRALQDAGFSPWSPWDPGRETWLPSLTLSDLEAPTGLEVAVDLHWRIPYSSYRSGSADTDAYLWRDADLDRFMPCPEAHVLLTAEHVVSHLRVVPHVIGLADLVRLLPRIEEPVRLRDLARERHALQPVRSILWLLRNGLGVDLDPELTETLDVPERPGILRARALRMKMLLEAPTGRREPRVTGLLHQALLQGSLVDALGELSHVLNPSAEWLRRRSGSEARGVVMERLGYWYALVRWVAGHGRSPLSPNQEFEDPDGRR